MKYKGYKGIIMERFMDKRQIREFDKQYDESKIYSLGRKEVEKKEK